MSSAGGLAIRPWTDEDSVSELTGLLHRAYADLAAQGMRFFASHQTEAQTLERIRRGECFLGHVRGRLVGTVTLYRHYRNDEPELYRRDDVAYFGQFGVEPELQGRGYGSALLDHVERVARDDGFTELALDTSERASELIAYYSRHGYRVVGHVQWREVNYRSILMAKRLQAQETTIPGVWTEEN